MDTSARNIYRILAIITSFILILVVAYIVRRPLIWIGAAFFLAVALNPAVEFFCRRVTGGRRGLAIGLTFTSFILALSLLLASLVPAVVTQTKGLSDRLPHYTQELASNDNFIGQILRRYDVVNRLQDDQAQAVEQLSRFSGSFVGVLQSIFNSIIATITVLGLTFFMLLEGQAWLERIWHHYPPARSKRYKKLANEMYGTVTGFVTGNVLTSGVAGITAAIALIVFGVPYAAPLAILVAILDLVPLVGATLAAIIVCIVALFHSMTAAIGMLIFFVVYQQLENHILQPIVYGKTVQISPLLVLISVLIGAALGGLLGALVAIPVAASLQILIKDYLSHRAKA